MSFCNVYMCTKISQILFPELFCKGEPIQRPNFTKCYLSLLSSKNRWYEVGICFTKIQSHTSNHFEHISLIMLSICSSRIGSVTLL